MKKIKFLGWLALIALVVIQFIPSGLNSIESDADKDFLVINSDNKEAASLLKNACYDCHSNQVKKPWYGQIAPINFWLASHVNHGREHLNFSEWATYSADDQHDLLKESAKEIEKEKMPLTPYTKMHPEADLDESQRKLLVEYLKSLAKR